MADNEDDKDNGDMETQGDGDHRSTPCDPVESGQLGGKVIFVVDFVALQVANDHCFDWRFQHPPLGDNTFLTSCRSGAKYFSKYDVDKKGGQKI